MNMSMMKAIIEPIRPKMAAQKVATNHPTSSTRQSADTKRPKINTPTPSTLMADRKIENRNRRERRCKIDS